MKKPKAKELSFEATKSTGKVSALLVTPENATAMLVLGHGAGAGMHQRFMEAIAYRLADQGIATFRYQFPYIEKGMRRPDPKPILFGTVRSAVDCATRFADDLPLLAGGKSMGGRMTSNACAEDALPGVKGIVFFGFPLHPPGKPSTERADHLRSVSIPMLFLQGTRDDLADLSLLKPICMKIGKKATLHTIEGADHSFHVLKSSGKTDELVLDELAQTTHDWSRQLL